MTYARQFALPFPLARRYAPEEFLAGDCNEAALAWLEQPNAWPALRLAVHGGDGTGKTHLLHWFAARHSAALFPAAAVRGAAPPPEAPVLCIDDADSVPDAEPLLHLLNAAAERRMPVLLTARTPPSRWPFTLPDLVSRLRAIQAVELQPPEDSLLRALLARLLAERQMAVSERLQEYLRARLPRTGGALREAAARLDRYALSERGAVTLDHARRVIADLTDPTPQEKSPEEFPPGLF